jgi:hypothetical protein
VQPVLYYPAGAAVLFIIAATLYYQRTSSRRAALATLRSATGWASAGQASAGYLARLPTSSSEHAEEQATPQPALAALAALGRLGHRLSPPAYTATRERRLQLAGKGRVLDQERFFALRLVTLAAVVPASALELLLPLRGLSALLGARPRGSPQPPGLAAAGQDTPRPAGAGRTAHDQRRSRAWLRPGPRTLGRLSAGAFE